MYSREEIEENILEILKEHLELTRGEIGVNLKIKERSTLYDALERLENKGLVKRYKDQNADGPGRPRVYWSLVQRRKERCQQTV